MDEILNKVKETFDQAGWESIITDKDEGSAFDVLLSNNGLLIGAIFIYSSKDALELKEKADQIQQARDKGEYKLIILTDGNSYETYIEGQYYGTSLTPMSYMAYSRRNRLMAYACALWSVYEKNN